MIMKFLRGLCLLSVSAVAMAATYYLVIRASVDDSRYLDTLRVIEVTQGNVKATQSAFNKIEIQLMRYTAAYQSWSKMIEKVRGGPELYDYQLFKYLEEEKNGKNNPDGEGRPEDKKHPDKNAKNSGQKGARESTPDSIGLTYADSEDGAAEYARSKKSPLDNNRPPREEDNSLEW